MRFAALALLLGALVAPSNGAPHRGGGGHYHPSCPGYSVPPPQAAAADASASEGPIVSGPVPVVAAAAEAAPVDATPSGGPIVSGPVPVAAMLADEPADMPSASSSTTSEAPPAPTPAAATIPTAPQAPAAPAPQAPSADAPAPQQPSAETPAAKQPLPEAPSLLSSATSSLVPEQTAVNNSSSGSGVPPGIMNLITSTDFNKVPSQDQLNQVLVDVHNEWRRAFQVPELGYNTTIANRALEQAKQCRWEHTYKTDKPGYSQKDWIDNMSARAYPNEDPNSQFAKHLANVVTAWASEYKYYDYAQGGWQLKPGHWQSVVWRNAVAIGCGWSPCDVVKGLTRTPAHLIVCMYDRGVPKPLEEMIPKVPAGFVPPATPTDINWDIGNPGAVFLAAQTPYPVPPK